MGVGTTASTWMDADLLRSEPELMVYTEDYDRRIQAVNREQAVQKDLASKRRAMKTAAMLHLTQDSMLKNESMKPSGWFSKKFFTILYRLMQTGVCSENRPGGLYEAMLSQIAGYSCSGVIWYQGESDDNHAEIYDRLFTAMIACWRSQWRQARLPFLFVQLAPFEEWTLSTGKNYPLLREQQQLVEDQAEDIYMASIMDAGSRYDIHPKDKRPVGERLARLALDRVYEIPTLCRAPRITEWKKKNGALTAVFGNVEDVLTQKADCAELFQIRAGEQHIPVRAALNGREIELQSELIHKNERYEVSFAYIPYCRMSVYGNDGLAARPSAPTMV